MNQGAYLETRKTNPAGIAFVISLHIGVLGAILLAPPEYVTRIVDVPLRMIAIPDAKTPPPRPLPPARHEASRPEQLDSVSPIIRPVDDNPVVIVPLQPPIIPHPDPGPILPPVAHHDPVLTTAQIDPRYAGDFQPAYPSRLMRDEVEGRVTVRVLIGADGRVKQVEPVGTAEPEFLEATRRQALAHWRFTPATKDGAPIESWRTMTVRFEMKA